MSKVEWERSESVVGSSIPFSLLEAAVDENRSIQDIIFPFTPLLEIPPFGKRITILPRKTLRRWKFI